MHGRAGSPKNPQGHGFIAATSTKRAGNTAVRAARATMMRAVFERLAQHFQRPPVEFRQLVEEQHAVVGEADLAGPWHAAAADQGRVGDGVMRRAERPVRHQARRWAAAGRPPSGPS